jgi:hypothetical protein
VLEMTKGQECADVQDLKRVSNGIAMNSTGIEGFCSYKYIIYTEVRSLGL